MWARCASSARWQASRCARRARPRLTGTRSGRASCASAAGPHVCASRTAGAGIRAAWFRPNADRGAHRAHGNLGEAMFRVAKQYDPVSRFALYRHARVLTFRIERLDTVLKTGTGRPENLEVGSVDGQQNHQCIVAGLGGHARGARDRAYRPYDAPAGRPACRPRCASAPRCHRCRCAAAQRAVRATAAPWASGRRDIGDCRGFDSTPSSRSDCRESDVCGRRPGVAICADAANP